MKKPIKLPFLPELRLNSPYWQNVIIGALTGVTGGLYVALNLLGAGGGKPNSASTVQVVNATLCTVWFFSANFGGTILNTIGPAFCGCLGVIGYMIYVGGLWYFDQTGHPGFPIFSGVAIGIGAGMIFVTMGYISMSYSEEQDRGGFITMTINLQATGAVIGGIIPLIINKDSNEAAGVPIAVYATFISLMGVGACCAFLLQPPSKIIRDDGTMVATVKSRGFVEELKSNLEMFKDWRLLVMIPAFLPSECFLVYGGSVNAYHNNLRTRCLLSFVSVVLQIPAGFGLQLILDHKTWNRRTRALLGLGAVGIPLIAAWVWEVVRTGGYDRHNPPLRTTDWTDREFIPIFFLFNLNWISSSLFQYIILYFLGCFSNSPRKAANHAGIYRGFLAAGEAINFGVDSKLVPYQKEAGVIGAFYVSGVLIFLYLALFHIDESQYFTNEPDVVIPKHVLAEHGVEGVAMEVQDPEHGIEPKNISVEKVASMT